MEWQSIFEYIARESGASWEQLLWMTAPGTFAYIVVEFTLDFLERFL